GVAHHVARQDGLVLDVEAERFLAGHIGRGQHGADAGFGGSGRDVKAHDPGMWMRAAEGRAPEHAVAAQVAGVLELALHLGDAIDPAHGLADPALSTDLDAHWYIDSPPRPSPARGEGESSCRRAPPRLSSARGEGE